MTIDSATRARFPRSAVPVWGIALLGAILVGLIAPRTETLAALPIVLFAGIMATFVIQLAIDQKVGFVTRVMVSLGGAVAILAVASAVLGTLALIAR